MRKFLRRSGITNVAFAGTVVVLIAIAGLGYALYGTSTSNQRTVTVGMTETNMMTETMTGMAQNDSFMFSPASGAMIANAWLLSAHVGNEYAVSIHAESLESNSTYIVEGALSSGSMKTVPISSQAMGMNTTAASEFQSSKNGTGLFWIQLQSNPVTTFENVQIYLLPEGMMQNATLVATVTFAMTH